MLRIIITIFLAGISTLSFAQQGGGDNGITLAGFFTIAQDDQAYAMLGNIFGPVGNVLHVSGDFIPKTLGEMFRTFNIVMLALNVIVIVYTTIFGLINTANEGEFLGKKFNSAWVPIRSVMGIGLLIPTSSGYCMLQVLMMWVVLQGIGAADSIWNVALQYPVPLHKGGGGQNQGSKSGSPIQQLSVASNFPRMVEVATCQAYLEMTSTKGSGSGGSGSGGSGSGGSGSGGSGSGGSGSGGSGSGSGSKGVDWDQSLCGNYTTPDSITIPSESDDAKKHFIEKGTKEALQAIQAGQKGGTLDVIGKAFAECYLEGLTAKKCLKGSGAQSILLEAAQPLVQKMVKNEEAYQGYKQNETGNKKQAYGWAYAGTFYHSIYTAAGDLAGFNPDINIKMPQTGESGMGSDVFDRSGTVTWSTYLDNIKDQVNNYMNEKGNYPTMSRLQPDTITHYSGGASSPFDAIVGGFVRMFVDMLIGQNKHFFMQQSAITGKFGKKNTSFAIQGNPITHLQLVGEQAIQLVEIMASYLFPILAGLLIAISVCGLSSPGATMGLSVALIIFSGFMALAGMLMSFGLLTAVYIPLVPYIIFYFGVLGWLMAVIETMLAAPMVAMGIASPDGQHEMLGRAEPAVMLVTNVFIRPTLMIFGLIAGFLLSLVGMEFLNNTYAYIVSKSLGEKVKGGSSSGSSNSVNHKDYMGPFQWIGYIVVYVSIVMALINKSYSMIHQIPDAVLRWIGGQASFGEYAKGEEEVKSSQQQGMQPVSQAGSAMGGVAAGGATASGKHGAKKVGAGGGKKHGNATKALSGLFSVGGK